VYQDEQLQPPPAQATEELVWDEEVTFEEPLAAETPMAEWLATDVLPDLPLTEPLGSETAPFNQTDSFVTAQLETAPAPGDESFAALADWLQTSDLPEDESISFDPLAEEQSAEEMLIEEELEIAEPALEVEFETVEDVMMDEAAPVILESGSLDDSEEEFVTSLLDTGETQTLPTWMTDVTGEATTAEAFAAEPLDAASDDALDWLDSGAPVGAVGVVAATLTAEPSAEDEVQPLDVESVDVLAPSDEDWGLDSDSLESVEVEDSEAEQLFKAELTTATAEETEEAIAEIEEPEVVEDNTYYSAFEDLPAAELEAVENGSNAPDWLNAMVPGLDIDTTAGAQGITDLLGDETTDETADAAAMPEDYQWLNEMVEEETQSDIIVPAVASQSPRFVFSRPPRWLRRLLERRTEDVDATDNSDLPAWLR
jgi:hypothetical protein